MALLYFTVLFVLLFYVEAQKRTNPMYESYWVSFSYNTLERKNRCITCWRQSCSGSWWWRRCRSYSYQSCTTYLATVTKTAYRCETGYTGCYCHIPICNNRPCTGGEQCVSPNNCQCTNTGGNCATTPCVDFIGTRDCYPGTCVNSSFCQCIPGFSGVNCQEVEASSVITECTASVNDQDGSVVGSASCANALVDSEVFWISERNPSGVRVSFRSTIDVPPQLPTTSRSDLIRSHSIGIHDNYVQYSTPAGAVVISRCGPYSRYENSRKCDKEIDFREIAQSVKNGDSFNLTATSEVGGVKTIFYNSRDNEKMFVQSGNNTAQRKVAFRFDFDRPYHCIERGTCEIPPILIDQDVRTTPDFQVNFTEWKDDLSLIAKYSIEIYFLNAGASGDLERIGDPVIADSNIAAEFLTFRGRLPRAGVYEIFLKVYDNAGNFAQAREIILYNPNGFVNIFPENPFIVEEFTGGNNRDWLTRGLQVSELNFVWTDRYRAFSDDAKYWLNGVKPWTEAEWQKLDDNRYGNITVVKVKNYNGVTRFGVRFDVYRINDSRLIYQTNYSYPEKVEEQRLSVSLPNGLFPGELLVIEMIAMEATEQAITEEFVKGVDVTLPDITDTSFQLNSRDGTEDNGFSTFYVNVIDRESGLDKIRYEMYDLDLRGLVMESTSQPPVTLQPEPSTRPTRQVRGNYCSASSPDCYCLHPRLNKCYYIRQSIVVDHCHIDRRQGNRIEMRITGVNMAGLETTTTIPFVVKDIDCREGVNIAAIVVPIVIIGLLIIIILLVIILLMRSRRRRNKHPVPRRIRTMAGRISHAVHLDKNSIYGSSDSKVETSVRKMETNSIYGSNPVKDVESGNGFANKTFESSKNNVYADNSNPNRLEPSQLEIMDKISEGKMFIVKTAYLTKGNERIQTAVKMCKRGTGLKEQDELNSRIVFWENHNFPHVNIPIYYGFCVGGPILVTEFCSTSLKKWLKDNSHVTSGVLETMNSFSLQLAQAMIHLHQHNIIHGHLGTRNVLLKKEQGDLTVKLIGFGEPEDKPRDPKEEFATKWAAPEALTAWCEGRKLCNKNTDVWTYGITLWEIYSCGEKPYPGKQSSQMPSLLKSGYRMERPRHCPEMLFETVILPCWKSIPTERPTFEKLVKTVGDVTNTNDDDGTYYAPPMNNRVQADEIYVDAK